MEMKIIASCEPLAQRLELNDATDCTLSSQQQLYRPTGISVMHEKRDVREWPKPTFWKLFHWPTQWSSSSSASTTVGSTPVGVCQILDSLGYWYTQICFMSVKNLALAQEWAIYFTPRARLDRPRAYRGWGGREVNLPEQFSLCFF